MIDRNSGIKAGALIVAAGALLSTGYLFAEARGQAQQLAEVRALTDNLLARNAYLQSENVRLEDVSAQRIIRIVDLEREVAEWKTESGHFRYRDVEARSDNVDLGQRLSAERRARQQLESRLDTTRQEMQGLSERVRQFEREQSERESAALREAAAREAAAREAAVREAARQAAAREAARRQAERDAAVAEARARLADERAQRMPIH